MAFYYTVGGFDFDFLSIVEEKSSKNESVEAIKQPPIFSKFL